LAETITGYDGYTAGDPEATRPGTPTYQALVAMWAERDMRYAKADKPLSESAIDAIRAYRLDEVKDLDPRLQGRAAMRVSSWYPPEHGQGAL